jgi:sirohydrochlorin cobaltochelatase
MRRVYADVATFIGVVEGTPSLEDFFDALDRSTTKKVLLKPFMIVAGDHAVNDMAGKEAASWKSILEARGYQVEAVLEGLGSNDGFADIFIDHIKDVAADNNISLQ